MDDAFAVGGIERVCNFDGQVEKYLGFDRAAADEVLQRLAVQEFHYDIGAAVLFTDIVNGANVGMIQRGSCLSLSFKTRERLWRFRYIIGQEFQRNETMQAGVFGLVNNAHASDAEFFEDAVVGERLADVRVRGLHVAHMLGFDGGQVNHDGSRLS